MSDAQDRTNSWENEQAPFTTPDVGVTTEAEAYAATEVPEPAPVPPPAPDPAYGTPVGYGYPLPTAGWSQAGSAYGVPPGVPPPTAGNPNPIAAFWLGLIPGVGAMYNGQVAKGFVHLIVFMVLVSIANHVDVFGIAVAGWIFFMAFEAYHTAKARRDGLPLPDPFGWNDIGEKVGITKGWPFHTAAGTPAGVNTPPPTTPPDGNWPTPPPATAAYGRAPVAPNWAGYVPPAAFASTPPAVAGTAGVLPGHGVPYAPVNAGVPYVPAADVPVTSSRLPVGAFWLIGLGVLFLAGQWAPLLRFGHIWIPTIILVAVAGLWFARRMGFAGAILSPARSALPATVRAASSVFGPGMILAVAILNALNEAWLVRWDRSWPWLLIIGGGLLLIERSAMHRAASLAAVTVNPTEKGGL